MLLILGLLIGLAFALRVHQLDGQSLWYDEGVTGVVAQYDLASLTRWTADDIQPPLYYYVVAAWGRLAGWSEWSLRFPSVFFGTLAVPLLSVLALRLTRSRLAAGLTALFTALHPLLIYYSQEARMYTLLVSLAILMLYTMERAMAAAEGKGHARWWAAYGLAATAAVYTHYFAFFLLLAQGIALALLPLRGPRRKLLRNFALASGAILLLYLPWIGNLFTRLNVDASYWAGTLKMWEALRKVAISFTSGETVLEAQATRLLWLYAAVTVVGGWQLAGGRGTNRQGDKETGRQGEEEIEGQGDKVTRWQGDQSPNTQYPIPNLSISQSPNFPITLSPRHLVVLITLIPIAAVLALASFTPKFNARYVMIALPGFILLWGMGLAAGLRGVRSAPASPFTRMVQILSLAGVLGLVAGFAYADRNWFTDPAFTKNQWRELAAYVQTHRQPDEAVILVSGHAWPIWRTYAPDVEPLRLPDIEILDVNAVLDYAGSAEALHRGLAGYAGAWLVNWQDEVVDPMDVVGLHLAQAGTEQPVDAAFWGLRLRHFTRLEPAEIQPEPPMQQEAHAHFDNAVELLGADVTQGGDLLLYWHPLSPEQFAQQDLHLALETHTTDGLLYAAPPDRRLAAYNYPSFRWRPGQTLVTRLPGEAWVGQGARPGNYWLHVRVYDPASALAGLDVITAEGAPLGKALRLKMHLPVTIPLATDADPRSWHEISPGVFIQATLSVQNVEPGQPLTLNILWQAVDEDAAIHGLRTRWNERRRAVQWDGNDFELDLQLQPGQTVRTVHRVRPPIDLPPDEYWLELTVDRMPTRPLSLPVTVAPPTRVYERPALVQVFDADFGGVVTLAGVTAPLPSQVAAGETLEVALVWQAQNLAPLDYAVTVQWLDENGRPVGQRDEPLPRGSSTWLPGEVVAQSMNLAAPQTPGIYRLIVAVYDPGTPGLPRLTLAAGGDAFQLARVTVGE